MRTIPTFFLLVTAFALAGCVSPVASMDLRNAAESAAHDVDPDATLIGVFGPEWTNESFSEEFREQSPEIAALDQGVDLNPGDGLASAWAFVFETSEDILFIAVGADGNVLETETIPAGSDTMDNYQFSGAIEEVDVDSDEAAQVVHDNHARFSDIVTAEDVVVVMALADSEDYGGTFWVFIAFTEDDEDFMFALVNAQTGEYQDFSQFGG